ncbi:MAG: DUF924 domain-containing protein [Pseudomonadales bacterium]|nr:DUF924 domain-containing protein [Pseudomonadales bacterium]MBO6595864.1 DUF924 domain-containing protein [Pseudomonadales bacterium]MBO6656729.1 DUF924 domain-containing protein [Pseudomonadales bacterium]MBO6822348.1 DUF924 domain-containing protein [Pseudomonadales bacterium]
MPTEASEIIHYWLGTEQNSVDDMKRQWKLWYDASDDTDNTIRARFGAALADAEAGKLVSWQSTAEGSLALVILLDQFSRNLFRSTPEAYRNDDQALAIAEHAVITGQHLELSIPGRVMLYHPYHHAEDTVMQEKAVQLFSELKTSSPTEWEEELENHLKFVRSHAALVGTYGRFPHRNQVLGRVSTEEEKAYLDTDKRTYGQ